MERLIWDLLDKSAAAPVDNGSIGDWFCVPVASLHTRAKIYEKCERYLPTHLNLPADDVVDQLFTLPTKKKIKKRDRLGHFIDSFGLPAYTGALEIAWWCRDWIGVMRSWLICNVWVKWAGMTRRPHLYMWNCSRSSHTYKLVIMTMQ